MFYMDLYGKEEFKTFIKELNSSSDRVKFTYQSNKNTSTLTCPLVT